jgi:hypothetical protein
MAQSGEISGSKERSIGGSTKGAEGEHEGAESEHEGAEGEHEGAEGEHEGAKGEHEGAKGEHERAKSCTPYRGSKSIKELLARVRARPFQGCLWAGRQSLGSKVIRYGGVPQKWLTPPVCGVESSCPRVSTNLCVK